jgi:hypothetical protein
MAKTILKVTPTHCAVKIYGINTTDTIDISTDLKLPSETPSSPKVNIKAFHVAITQGYVTVSRNGTVLWALNGCESLIFNGFYDTQNNDEDLVFTFHNSGSHNATIIVELIKVGGYGDEQHRNPLS